MNKSQFQLSDISTASIFRTLIRNLWMIVAAALILYMSCSLYLTSLRGYQYQSAATYAITYRTSRYGGTNHAAAAEDLSHILTQLNQTGIVANKLRKLSPELADFSGSLSFSTVGKSNFMIVSSTCDAPRQAFLAVSAMQELLPQFSDYLSSDVVPQLIRNPSISASPINELDPSLPKKAGLLGGLAMTALLVWMTVQRQTVQTRSGARHLLDAPIIASVVRTRPARRLKNLLRRKRPIQVFDPTTPFAYTEQINAICTRLEQEQTANGRKVFLVAGVGENEGKSTISGNVAAALAIMGYKVALVEGDLRNPSLNAFFDHQYDSPVPLNDLLAHPYSGDRLLACARRHESLDLAMLFPLEPDPRCTELLAGPTMKTVLQKLRVFDFVIVDTPPMGYFADAESLAEQVDATMLVVRQDHTPACDINDQIDLLRSAKSEFLGVILNDMTHSMTEGLHAGHSHNYGYGYGYGHKS